MICFCDYNFRNIFKISTHQKNWFSTFFLTIYFEQIFSKKQIQTQNKRERKSTKKRIKNGKVINKNKNGNHFFIKKFRILSNNSFPS